MAGHGDTNSLATVASARHSASRATRSPLALRALGVAGLVGVPASAFGVAGGAAGAPTQYVPGRSGGWPAWLYGPLHGLGLGIGSSSFQTLTLAMCASYVAVLLAVRVLPGRAIAAAIVAVNVVLLLGPPLISQDVFGYLSFARLGVLHGLDPYTHVAAEAPTDAVFPFVGWSFQNSPYGPLFTLATYPLATLGLAGGLWALKGLAVACSLGAVALTARAAQKMGRSAKWAAAFVGLNPVTLELAVGGAHNDTLVLLVLAGALLLTAGASAIDASKTDASDVDASKAGGTPNLRAAAALLVVGVGVKASAGLVLPFVVLAPHRMSERVRVAASAAGALVLLALVAIVGFGTHAFGFLDSIGEQQQLIATHSIPAETARWVGLAGTPAWWRDLWVVGFVLVLALTLWRTARGADWRTMAGWATLGLLLSTAWLLPWYAVWVLPLAALADSRRLRGATLAFCAYAILIHLPLADPLLSPARHVAHTKRVTRVRAIGATGGAGPTAASAAGARAAASAAANDRVVFAGLEVVGDPALDLRGRGVGAQSPQA
jgi:alpha-1,6-mannosyltransferase